MLLRSEAVPSSDRFPVSRPFLPVRPRRCCCGIATATLWCFSIISLTAISHVAAATTSENYCRINDASYGDAEYSTVVAQFSEIIGVACNSHCFDEASQWSQVAIDHGNNPVQSENECSDLCAVTKGCDVWTYWPNGIHNTDIRNDDEFCDICPKSIGGILDIDGKYYDDEARKYETCEGAYDYFQEVPYDQTGLEGIKCEEVQSYFEGNKCCRYEKNSELLGACQLFSAAPYNHAVLTFLDKGSNIATGPKDCNQTVWLPFMESTSRPPREESKVECSTEWCNSWGNDCYASDAWGEPQTCSKGSPIPLDGSEYTCCLEDEDVPTPSPTMSLPLSSSGLLCWINGHSYGVVEDGSCANADITSVIANDDKFNLGLRQGWWDNTVERLDAATLYNNNVKPINCQNECIINNSCTGWDYANGVCILKSITNNTCSPTVAKKKYGGNKSLDRVAGVNGCVDSESSISAENSAFDTSNLWFMQADLPRCTEPHSYGSYSGDTFIPQPKVATEKGCWYKYFTHDEVYDCSQNRWIVLNGGSNVLSLFIQLTNLFAPIPIFDNDKGNDRRPYISFDETFTYNVIDIVFSNDSLPHDGKKDVFLHYNLKRFCDIDDKLDCGDGSLNFMGGLPVWSDDYLEALQKVLGEAPYQSGSTRLTLVVGQIWQNGQQVLRAIDSTYGGWENSKVVYFGQAMIWYPCNYEGWCEMKSLGSTKSQMLGKYREDLDGLMTVGETTCGTSRFDCFFATHGYEDLYDTARQLIGILDEITSKYKWANFVDLNGFIIRSENMAGHVTPFIWTTLFQMIWNTVCTVPYYGKPDAIKSTTSCFSDCIRRGGGDTCDCPENSEGGWTCANERQCNFEKLNPVPWEIVLDGPTYYAKLNSDTKESCFDVDVITTSISSDDREEVLSNDKRIMTQIKDIGSEKMQHTSRNLISDDYECSKRTRVWCGSKGEAWGLSIGIFFTGVITLIISYMQKKRTLSSSPSSVTNNDDKVEKIELQNDHEDQQQSVILPNEHLHMQKKRTLSSSPSSVTNNDDKVEKIEFQNDYEDQQQSVLLPKEHLHSLGCARLLASFHIVLGHLYAKGAIENFYFFGWGYTWVPWFFVLSGYVLTHARLHSSDPSHVDGPFYHVAKRLSTIFPVYAFSVVFSLIIRMKRGADLPNAMVLIAQSFLLQTWIPLWTEKALQGQCWFLSNLILYWIGFGPLYKLLRNLSLKWTSYLLLFISILPWITVLVPVIDDNIANNWYAEHRYGETASSVDIWTVMLKFHPLFYMHVFVFGMLLAIFRTHLKRQVIKKEDSSPDLFIKVMKFIIRFGASLGYLGLILVFSIEEIQPVSYKLSARLSILLPLQGLMILGLSPLPQQEDTDPTTKRGIVQDPLAILFALAPAWVGDLSYCQYVLQFPLYSVFPVEQITNPSFFMFLLGGSVLCLKLLHEPCTNGWRYILKADTRFGSLFLLVLPASLLAFILGISKVAYTSNYPVIEGMLIWNATNYTLSSPYVRLAPEAVDMQLNWTISSDIDVRTTSSQMNPSILFREDGEGNTEIIRSVRLNAVGMRVTEGKRHNGKRVTEILEVFDSSILLQSEMFQGNLSVGFDDEDHVKKWGLDGVNSLVSLDMTLLSHLGKNTKWSDLCEPEPMYNKEEKMLKRKQVLGPEDPKLFELPKRPGFTSDWGLSFSSYPPASLLSYDSSSNCKWESQAVMQMHLASRGQALASGEKAPGVKLNCGHDDRPEKNWISFTYKEHLYYIYSIEPHVVVHVRISDGACVESYETSFSNLIELANQGVNIRGSATALRYSEDEYLALLHTYDSAMGYRTLAYTFEAEPPFRVRRVSKPLSLQGGGLAFASSLSLQGGKVLVGYGENDQAARVLVMSEEYFETMFDWCQ